MIFGTSGCNKKVNPESYIHVVHMSNVAHQMKENITVQNNYSHFKSKIELKFEICSFFSGSKQPEKRVVREIENCIYYLGCLANYNFILVDYTFF